MYSVLFACTVPRIARDVSRYVPSINPDIELTVVNKASDVLKVLAANPSIEIVVCEHGNGLDAFQLFDDICKTPGYTTSFILTTSDQDMSNAVRAFEYHMEFLIYHEHSWMTFYVELAQKILISCERHRIADIQETDGKRKNAIATLVNMYDRPFTEVLSYALESSVSVTNSQVGYFATYSAPTRKLNILAWSIKAMDQCRMLNHPMEYDLDSSGLWGEPIRLMKDVIVSDYEQETVYHKNGIPAGHVKLKNILMVPIIHNGVPVATAGVANKNGNYTDEDAAQLRMLNSSLTMIYRDRLLENESRNRENLLGAILNTSPYGILCLDRDMRIKACSRAAELLLDLSSGTTAIGNLKEFQNNKAVSSVLYTVAQAYEDNESKNSFVKIDEGSREGNYSISVNLLLDPDGSAEGSLISIINLSDFSGMVHSDNNDIKKTRMIADTIATILAPLIESAPHPAQGTQDDLLDVLDYLETLKRLGSAGPVWQKLKDCIPAATDGIEIEVDTGPVNVLADQTFNRTFACLLRFSKRSGAKKAEIGITVDENGLAILYRDNGEGIPDTMKRNFSSGEPGLGLWAETLFEISSMSGFRLKEVGTYGEGTSVSISVPPNKFFIGKMQ